MQHRRKGRKLGRVKKIREALFKTLLGSVFLHEKIKTTEAKAKEIQPKVERLVSKALKVKFGSSKMTVARELKRYLPGKSVEKILGGFLDQFGEKKSGFTRVIKLGRRKSDGAKMAIIEFVK